MKLTKKLLIGAVALTALGTINGSEGYPPFYTLKTGTSGGINIGFVNKFEKGAKHYGINIGCATLIKDGANINGLNLNIMSFNDGRINGASVGVGNLSGDGESTKENPPAQAGEINGIEAGFFNYRVRFAKANGVTDSLSYVNGLQVGFINAGRGNVLWQVGLWNYNTNMDETKSRGVPIVNWRFD